MEGTWVPAPATHCVLLYQRETNIYLIEPLCSGACLSSQCNRKPTMSPFQGSIQCGKKQCWDGVSRAHTVDQSRGTRTRVPLS